MDAEDFNPALKYGAQITGSNIDSSTIEAGDLADDAVTASKIADNAVETDKIKNDAVNKDKLDYEVAEVTVTAGNNSGTATVTAGSIILGYYPTSNQDQFVDSIAISDTTLTVTLAANATADNVFKVVLLKA